MNSYLFCKMQEKERYNIEKWLGLVLTACHFSIIIDGYLVLEKYYTKEEVKDYGNVQGR